MKSSGRPHQFHFTFLGFLLLKTGLGERGGCSNDPFSYFGLASAGNV